MNKKQYDKATELHILKTTAQALAEGYEILDANCSEDSAKRAAQLEKLVAKQAPFFHVIAVIDIRDDARFDWRAYPRFARIRAFDRNLSILDQALEAKRAEVVAHQIERANARIDFVFAELAKFDNDLSKYAPYPSTKDYDYSAKKDKHNFALSLANYSNYSHKPGVAVTLTRSTLKIDRYLANVEKNAHADFDSYLTKLAGKVGTVTEASLDDVYLWSGSVLTVKTEAGEVQKWKTQIIVNFSSLGKAFNQWPTRKIK